MYREISQSELKLNKALGYLYFIDNLHPLAIGKARWVYYHRHVASIAEGHWLTSNEVVHHINGNKLDNRIDNLQVMSRSEHALEHNPKEIPDIVCSICGITFTPERVEIKYCSTVCGHKSREKQPSITKEELEPMIWLNSLKSLETTLGMSDNGIKKLALRLGCVMPPPRFHVKYVKLEEKKKQYALMLL